MLTENFLQSLQNGTSNYCFLLSSQKINLTSSDMAIVYEEKEYKTGLSKNSISVPIISNVKNNITIQVDCSIFTFDYNQLLDQRIDIAIFDITKKAKMNLYKGVISSFAKSSSTFIDINITSILNKLSIQTGNLFSPMCRANLGDDKCKVNLNNFQKLGKVETVFNNSTFSGNHIQQEFDYFKMGYIKFTTGENIGLSFQVKNEINSTIFLLKGVRFALKQGDEYIIYPGCNKSSKMCKERFKNLINFQGEPFINS
ncbi:MAG: hypothetical protein RL208_679 [Pseudomonadota bacterium]|jgi:uncharacterized phage protein (TIGR02218 family)